MIRIHFIILALLVLCGSASADDPELPQITVYGTATALVPPDTLIWNLTVKNIDLELEDAADEHNKLVKKVLNTLKKRGVSEKEIQTARMQFGDNIDPATRSKSGYYASTAVSFKTKDFSKYQSLWMDLAQMENVSIQSVNYDHSNRIQYQNETRQKALLAGRAKAETMATTLGSKIGEPLLIEEDPSVTVRSGITVNDVRSLGVAASSEVLAPGEITILARVKISFRLINPE